MLESGKITTRQFTLILFCIISSVIYYGVPRLIIAETREDCLLVVIAAWALEVALAIVFYILGLRYPGETMVEYSTTIMGSWLGKPIGLFFTTFYALTAGFLLQALTTFFKTALMPETPTLVFILVILGVAWYTINAGLEVIGRTAEILAPLMLIVILLVLSLNVKNVQLVRLLPVFQHSIGEMIKPSFLVASFFGFCIAMGMFQAYHNKPEETLKAKFVAITGSSFLSILIGIELIGACGVNLTVTQVYPVFRLAQMIKAGDIFERLEYGMVMFWVAGTFIAFAVLQYCCVLGLAQVFNLKSYQKLTPFAAIAIGLYVLYSPSSDAARFAFLQGPFFYFALFVEDFLMILLFCVSFLRHGRKTTKARR